MKTAAAAVAAPTIVPSTVFGQNAPSNRVVMAWIGTGDRGRAIMRQFLRRDDVQVIAGCDVDRSRVLDARDIIERTYAASSPTGYWRGCDVYDDFRDVLAREDIDAVAIATTDNWHALVGIAAAEAGKDMYCEKPLTVTIGEGRALSDAVRRNSVICQVGSQQRSDERFRQACELAINSRIGKVQTVYVGLPDAQRQYPTKLEPEMPIPEGFDYNFWLGPAPKAPYTAMRCHFNFRWIFDYSGGMICDWGAHHIDIAQWGLGMEYTGPVEIEGVGEFYKDGLWNTANRFNINYRYKNGVVLNLATTNVNKQGVKFVGSEGSVFVSRSEISAEPISLLNAVIGPDEIHLYRSANHFGNFIDCVKSRETPIAPVEVAHRSITLAHLGNVSMLLGRKVQWNPDTERFVNDPAADRMIQRPMRSPWRLS